MNVADLEVALENNSNEGIFHLSNKIINITIKQMIKTLDIVSTQQKEIIKKLKGYRYVDEISNLKHGSIIRYIKCVDGNLLNKCCILCDVKISDNGILIVGKNFYHKHISFLMEDYLIFQKLSFQEKVILNSLDYLLT